MRIGIDVDCVLRDFIGNLKSHIIDTHPEYTDKILSSQSWHWKTWLPFWTNEQTEKYIYEDNYTDLFGPKVKPIKSSIEDWNNFVEWAKDNNHELVIVSAQKPHTKKLTDDWLDFWGFCVKERHYTHKKYSVDIDVLIDDSPTKLIDYKKYSINNGIPICYNQNWNIECRKKMISINRLSKVKKVLL